MVGDHMDDDADDGMDNGGIGSGQQEKKNRDDGSKNVDDGEENSKDGNKDTADDEDGGNEKDGNKDEVRIDDEETEGLKTGDVMTNDPMVLDFSSNTKGMFDTPFFHS